MSVGSGTTSARLSPVPKSPPTASKTALDPTRKRKPDLEPPCNALRLTHKCRTDNPLTHSPSPIPSKTHAVPRCRHVDRRKAPFLELVAERALCFRLSVDESDLTERAPFPEGFGEIDETVAVGVSAEAVQNDYVRAAL